jgi:hypothetical protein
LWSAAPRSNSNYSAVQDIELQQLGLDQSVLSSTHYEDVYLTVIGFVDPTRRVTISGVEFIRVGFDLAIQPPFRQ